MLWALLTSSSIGVAYQKVVHELSPRSGRNNVAHGVSRGLACPSFTPAPSPARAGEGCRRRGEGPFPQGSRPGLRSFAPLGLARIAEPGDLPNELQLHDTRNSAISLPVGQGVHSSCQTATRGALPFASSVRRPEARPLKTGACECTSAAGRLQSLPQATGLWLQAKVRSQPRKTRPHCPVDSTWERDSAPTVTDLRPDRVQAAWTASPTGCPNPPGGFPRRST